MPLTPKDQELLRAFSNIQRVAKDQALPRPVQSTDQAYGPNNKPLGPPKKTVEQVIQENSIVNGETGQTIVDDNDLHPNDMDLEDLRRELKDRFDRAQTLRDRLATLAANTEKKILAKGPQDVQVDTAKDVNLRRAISRIYGQKTNVITFEMYKQALALRDRARQEEVNAASEGHKFGSVPGKKNQ